jgi:hypothetical protein
VSSPYSFYRVAGKKLFFSEKAVKFFLMLPLVIEKLPQTEFIELPNSN